MPSLPIFLSFTAVQQQQQTQRHLVFTIYISFCIDSLYPSSFFCFFIASKHSFMALSILYSLFSISSSFCNVSVWRWRAAPQIAHKPAYPHHRCIFFSLAFCFPGSLDITIETASFDASLPALIHLVGICCFRSAPRIPFFFFLSKKGHHSIIFFLPPLVYFVIQQPTKML